METIEHYVGNETLVVVKCWCGIRHAVPQSLRREQMRRFNEGQKPQGVYCPLGHSHVPSGETETDRIKRQLEREQARSQRLADEAATTERRLRAAKGQVTKIKNRVGKGVCPCCNRTFQNLHRHMATQHPEYAKGDA